MLASIVSLYKNVVVAGSHGKTTTTSIVSTIFSKSNLDPTTINEVLLIQLVILLNLEKVNGVF